VSLPFHDPVARQVLANSVEPDDPRQVAGHNTSMGSRAFLGIPGSIEFVDNGRGTVIAVDLSARPGSEAQRQMISAVFGKLLQELNPARLYEEF